MRKIGKSGISTCQPIPALVSVRPMNTIVIHPLEKWRKAKAFTQTDLAKLAGCSVEVIHKAETHKPIREKYVDRFLQLAADHGAKLKRADFQTIAPGKKHDGNKGKRKKRPGTRRISAIAKTNANIEAAKALRGRAGADRRRQQQRRR